MTTQEVLQKIKTIDENLFSALDADPSYAYYAKDMYTKQARMARGAFPKIAKNAGTKARLLKKLIT